MNGNKSIINKRYQDINKLLLEKGYAGMPNKNFCQFFTHGNNKKMAILAYFDKKDVIYGIRPELTQRKLFELINNHKNTNEETLNEDAYLKVLNDLKEYFPIDNNFDIKSENKEKIRDALLLRLVRVMLTKKSKTVFDDVLNMNIYVCSETSLYNGINNRLLEVENKDNVGMGETTSLKLRIQRTTFFTTLAMENVDIRLDFNQDFKNLCAYQVYLDEFDQYEVDTFNTFYSEICSLANIGDNEKPEEGFYIETLNKYLRESKLTHYINVSCNITTSDGYLLYTVRNSKATNEKCAYCSANGVSEVYDKSVDFYCNSVNVDKPSILFNVNEERIDFTTEMEREINAELALYNLTHHYEFYGLTMMGLVEYNEEKTKVIRINNTFHFNILMETECFDNFDVVIKQSKSAVEKFENNRIYGWKLNLYATQEEKMRTYLPKIGAAIEQYSDLILSIILFVSIIFFRQQQSAFELIQDAFMIISGLLVLVKTIILIRDVQAKKDQLCIQTVDIYKKKDIGSIKDLDTLKQAENFILNPKSISEGMHYIYLIMSICYYLNKIDKEEDNISSR